MFRKSQIHIPILWPKGQTFYFHLKKNFNYVYIFLATLNTHGFPGFR